MTTTTTRRMSPTASAKYYFYGAGGSGYYGPGGTYDINSIWTSGSMAAEGFIDMLLTDIKLCATFGLKRVAYEAGPGFDDATDVQRAAWHDSRLTRTVIQNTMSGATTAATCAPTSRSRLEPDRHPPLVPHFAGQHAHAQNERHRFAQCPAAGANHIRQSAALLNRRRQRRDAIHPLQRLL